MHSFPGMFVEEGGDKWYEKQWFYIACGVVGAVLLCCLCLLCGRAHRDNSGRGTGKAHPAGKTVLVFFCCPLGFLVYDGLCLHESGIFFFA